MAQGLSPSQSVFLTMFREALLEVLRHDADKRILLTLSQAGREMRWEELRRAIGSPAPQTFKDAMDRLMRTVAVNRRLVEEGDRHQSHLSLTPTGRHIATVLVHVSEHLPESVPVHVRRDAQAVFRGTA